MDDPNQKVFFIIMGILFGILLLCFLMALPVYLR